MDVDHPAPSNSGEHSAFGDAVDLPPLTNLDPKPDRGGVSGIAEGGSPVTPDTPHSIGSDTMGPPVHATVQQVAVDEDLPQVAESPPGGVGEISPTAREYHQQYQAEARRPSGAAAHEGRCCTMRVWTAYSEFTLRHPFARLLNCAAVIVANFMLYAEDPMAHSMAKADLPTLGHTFNLLFYQWPSNAGLVFVKIGFAVGGFAFGLWIGKRVVHDRCLRDCCKMQAFGYPKKLYNTADLDEVERAQLTVLPDGTVLRPQIEGEQDKGSWFIMTLTTFTSLVLTSAIYNGIVAESSDDAPTITGKLPMSNETFYKIAASGGPGAGA